MITTVRSGKVTRNIPVPTEDRERAVSGTILPKGKTDRILPYSADKGIVRKYTNIGWPVIRLKGLMMIQPRSRGY